MLQSERDENNKELLRLNKEIKQNLEFKKAILEASLDATITIDIDNKIIEWNRAAEDIFGYKCEEAVGQSLIIMLHPYIMRLYLVGRNYYN